MHVNSPVLLCSSYSTPPLAPLTDRNKPAVWAATPREAGWILCKMFVVKFHVGHLAHVLLNEGLWLCRLLVEILLKIMLVRYHLQNDCSWWLVLKLFWNDGLERLSWGVVMTWWLNDVCEWWFYEVVMKWEWGVGGCRVVAMMGRWARGIHPSVSIVKNFSPQFSDKTILIPVLGPSE